MLRVARALLAMRDPLDAELALSRMLGAWWGRSMPGMSGDDVERHLGEGLIARATAARSPAGLALLSGIAALGPTEHRRELARQGALALSDHGMALPAWVRELGAARPVAAYRSGDRFGDADEVVCTFRRTTEAEDPADGPAAGSGAADAPGEPDEASATHALIAVIDHNAGGVLRDAWVTSKVGRLLEHARTEAGHNPMAVFTRISPGRARTLLEAALRRTDRVVAGGTGRPARLTAARRDDLLGGSLSSVHALLRSRMRALPREGRPAPEPVWRRDDRATLAARFLASETAAELSDSYAASRCVDHIIAYGCDVDGGRPLRVSPRKVEAFLLTWLPRRVVLLREECEAMPHVLGAWIRWAGPRWGLPEPAVGAALDALWEAIGPFTETYRDPAESLGLGRREVRRLLPDGDLEALPRRMFAFPLLAGDLLDDAEGAFDPSTAQGRRALLKLDHFGEIDDPEGRPRGRHSVDGGRTGAHRRAASGSGRGGTGCSGRASERDSDRAAAEAELAAHERLAERLWEGDPPELWAAAQRLLDRGESRPAVLRALIAAMEAADRSGRPGALADHLNDL
ncbi:hypothetical protein O4J56_15070 [Nocardiopsis sp. RSe5-2]|uniref:Uncharacterized protein n=1 Tax=Nocardiopsis endophytica TaxID=3018445 RepID=A0ABT4U6H9_9ACTN|nr:hypothetical protein [Nocardiopsis endophytica]MDA2811962.1 hypothetical protein [Nocardiopsis endophytica]